MLAELTKVAIWALSPVGVWVWLTALALCRAFGRGHLRTAMLWLAGLQLLAFATPPVSEALFGGLEQQGRALQAARPLDGPVKAIVVLGGGIEGPYRGTPPMGDMNEAADRVFEAARLYKQGVSARVVASGGSFSEDPTVPTEALAMRTVLEQLGVPAHNVLTEEQSRTTFENALRTRDALGPGQHRIALVTSAYHMPRSVMWFEHVGFDVYPVVCDVRVEPTPRRFWQWLPSPRALAHSTLAIQEHLGVLQRKVARWYSR